MNIKAYLKNIMADKFACGVWSESFTIVNVNSVLPNWLSRFENLLKYFSHCCKKKKKKFVLGLRFPRA